MTVTNQLLKALNNLRFKEIKGDMNAQIKRSLLYGGDQKTYGVVDVLEGLSDADIAGFIKNLTSSHEAFITQHCRRSLNGVFILQSPAGSGKTTLIKPIVQIAHKHGLKGTVVTGSNSAADNVIVKVADPFYIAVRVHGQSLERRLLLRTSRQGVDLAKLKPADPEPDDDAEHDVSADFQGSFFQSILILDFQAKSR